MSGSSENKASIEKKISVALIALETLIVNDKNLEMALENDVLRVLVKVIRGLPVRGAIGTNG